MATYVVTGGAGFIGSHLVQALLEEGHTVRVVDNFSTGKRERLCEGAECFEGDLRDLDAIRPAFRDAHGVFHAAALPSIQFSFDFPVESHAVNVTGTLHVLEAAREAGVQRVVYSASASAYGDHLTMPLHEGLRPAPKSPYGLQKYVGEEYCKVYSLCHAVETVNLRYFNVYGPRMPDEGAYNNVIAIFLRQRQEGEPLTITGDGMQTRDFVHVRDVVRANMLAMTSDRVGFGEAVNIGVGTSKSVSEVAALIGGPTVHIAPRLELHDALADNRRARILLGWEPTVSFDEGIQELLELHGLSKSTSRMSRATHV